MPKTRTRRRTALASLAFAALLLVMATLSTVIDWQRVDAQDERRAVAITASAEHACALLDSGEIECWGSGYGQTDAPAGHFHAVSAGGGHTCALRETSEIACWGWNDSGQTDAPAGRSHTVSAGGSHTCGLRSSGKVECWGNDTIGRWLRSTEIKLGF